MAKVQRSMLGAVTGLKPLSREMEAEILLKELDRITGTK